MLGGIVLTTKIREIEGGMDDYITKPIDIAVLRQSFEKCADAIAAAN